MKKNITLLILLIACQVSGILMANPVTESQAQAVAASFFSANNAKSGATLGDKAVQTSVAFDELYIFCGTDNHGFVIVSADDCVTPILGYSFESTFDPVNMPPQLIWWLQRYERMISQLRSEAGQKTQTHPEWDNLLLGKGTKDAHQAVVGPLIATRWGQGSTVNPTYNKFCPLNSNNQYTITGCVATAGAQIMKYWNYPAVGRGSASYALNNVEFTNFPLSVEYNTPYDWENMPTHLYTSSSTTQIDAVALLMYHIGVGVHMDYKSTASGAVTSSMSSTGSTLEAVLRNNFKYSNTVCSVEESQFEADEWKALLKKELDEGRPMVYGGQGSYGGHAFICDGYDNDGCFHFNWGWQGLDDGYFVIGALNPSPYDFNDRCDVIIGIQPRKGNEITDGGLTTISVTPNNPQYGTTTGSGSYSNYSPVTITASANPGYQFVRWSDNSRYQTRSFLALGGTQSITAIFEEVGGNPIIGPGAEDIYGRFWGSYIDASTSWGVRIDPSSLAQATQLEAVRIKPRLQTTDGGSAIVNMMIYSGGETPDASSATPIYTQNSIAFQTWNEWYTITLPTPIAINSSQCVWITFQPTSQMILFYPESTQAPAGSCWQNYRGYGWESMDELYQIQGIFGLAPNPPVENLTVTVNTALTISWNAPTAATPSSYTVAIGTTDESHLLDLTPSSSTSISFSPSQLASLATISTDDLRRNTNYYIFVRANYTNANGQNYYSSWKKTLLTHNFRSDGTVEVTTNTANENAGYTTGGGFYAPGASVTLQAIPFIGYEFSHWNDNNTQPTRSITAPATDINYTAYFTRTQHPVTVTFDATMGLVDVDGQLLSSSSTVNLPAYATIPFTAIPAEGYKFSHWLDGNTTNPRYTTITGPFSLEAVFAADDGKGYTIYTKNRSINIQTDEFSKLEVYDMLGRHIISSQCDAASSVSLPIAMPGIYLVKIGNQYEKIIVM